MSPKTLYIIGNGFDRHHGIPSRYSDFRNYLSSSDHRLLDLVEQFIFVKEDWSDFEQALAKIDASGIADSLSEFLASYGAEDWSDSYHHNYQYEVGRITKGLSTELKTRFAEWISQLHIPNRTEVESKILDLDKAGTYLTFNYTSTLSTIYEVPRANILFIHGEVGKQNQEIVLGHAWNPRNIPSLNDVSDPESLDTRIMEGNKIINDYFGKTFKNTSSIIDANKAFFSGLSEISKIFVLGHSLSDVDIRYFEAIIQNIDADKVHWRISYHGNNELTSHQNTMNALGIDSSNLSLSSLQDF